MVRAREIGIVLGFGTPGPRNAITDVEGVRVGHATLIEGHGPLVPGRGPIRTGVTVVIPHDGDPWSEPVFAGCHRLNGNGELTGLEWVRESGYLTSPVAITNTHSVGVVRDALVAEAARRRPRGEHFWSLPVVGETYDGTLNDINGFHVRPEHVTAALRDAADAVGGDVAEGAVGGGTGMTCHEFKGGIGTASRRLPPEEAGYTVGVLVQANYGRREELRVDGVPVGVEIPVSDVPSPRRTGPPGPGSAPGAGPAAGPAAEPGAGSIIVVVATDAPLLPHQCERLAQRAVIGIARMGGTARHTSGDLIIAFATGNRGLPDAGEALERRLPIELRMVPDGLMSPLFDAAAESTEEAILNALLGAEDMTGRDGRTAHRLDPDRLVAIMARYGRGPMAGARPLPA